MRLLCEQPSQGQALFIKVYLGCMFRAYKDKWSQVQSPLKARNF